MAANTPETLARLRASGESILAETHLIVAQLPNLEPGSVEWLRSMAAFDQLQAKTAAYLEESERAKQRYRDTYGEDPF